MPKATSKSNSCADCKKSLANIHHECVRHSLCVDHISGLWNPSVCTACQNLISLSYNTNDANNKEKLLTLVTKIRSKVVKKCKDAFHIFANDELRENHAHISWLKGACYLSRPVPSPSVSNISEHREESVFQREFDFSLDNLLDSNPANTLTVPLHSSASETILQPAGSQSTCLIKPIEGNINTL